MAHGVLKQCGGFISVDSKPNAGSTFAVHLPGVTSLAPTPAK
jgi:signal transduction histidine kinase